jgi:hypothetical protein
VEESSKQSLGFCGFFAFIGSNLGSSSPVWSCTGCRACISRFKDCPLCGADVDEIVPDPEMQTLVDQFIEGHARIKGTPLNANSADGETGESEDQSNVVYEDASSARGSFLVQQAMRVGFFGGLIRVHD